MQLLLKKNELWWRFSLKISIALEKNEKLRIFTTMRRVQNGIFEVEKEFFFFTSIVYLDQMNFLWKSMLYLKYRSIEIMKWFLKRYIYLTTSWQFWFFCKHITIRYRLFIFFCVFDIYVRAQRFALQ